jgi:hypothetical protein
VQVYDVGTQTQFAKSKKAKKKSKKAKREEKRKPV